MLKRFFLNFILLATVSSCFAENVIIGNLNYSTISIIVDNGWNVDIKGKDKAILIQYLEANIFSKLGKVNEKPYSGIITFAAVSCLDKIKQISLMKRYINTDGGVIHEEIDESIEFPDSDHGKINFSSLPVVPKNSIEDITSRYACSLAAKVDKSIKVSYSDPSILPSKFEILACELRYEVNGNAIGRPENFDLLLSKATSKIFSKRDYHTYLVGSIEDSIEELNVPHFVYPKDNSIKINRSSGQISGYLKGVLETPIYIRGFCQIQNRKF